MRAPLGFQRLWASPQRRAFAIGAIALTLLAVVGTVAVLEARWEPDAGYEEAVGSDDPIVWWRLDELRGDVARDSTLPALDARYRGEIALGVQGPLSNRLDTAASFNGSTYLLLGDRLDFAGLSPYSVEAWVRPRPPQPSPFTRIVSKETADRGGTRQGWSLYFNQADGALGFERLAGRRAHSAYARVRLPADRYTYLVGTFDGSILRLYIDGQEVADSGAGRPIELEGTSGPLTIGRLSRPATAFYAGSLDEIAIYARALSAAEIEAHWTAAR